MIQHIGLAEPPEERKLDACDFQGNDFTTLYCLDRENFGPEDFTDLSAVDTETAELTYLASFPLTGVDYNEGVNGLAYDPTTGKMFAVTCDAFFGETDTLYELHLKDLTLTQIGESSEGLCVAALAADNDGHLWAPDLSADVLYSIDKGTGEMTMVGPLDVHIAFGNGMDCDASNNTCYLFAFNEDTDRGELHRCDTATGHTQFVGILGQDFPGAGHWGTGAIAAPGPCHLSLELASSEVPAGDELSVRIRIVHNRADTVTVPFTLTLEDASGRVVASRTSAPFTMNVGDHLERDVKMRLPSSLSPGAYTVTFAVGQMEQGSARASAPLTVHATSFD